MPRLRRTVALPTLLMSFIAAQALLGCSGSSGTSVEAARLDSLARADSLARIDSLARADSLAYALAHPILNEKLEYLRPSLGQWLVKSYLFVKLKGEYFKLGYEQKYECELKVGSNGDLELSFPEESGWTVRLRDHLRQQMPPRIPDEDEESCAVAGDWPLTYSPATAFDYCNVEASLHNRTLGCSDCGYLGLDAFGDEALRNGVIYRRDASHFELEVSDGYLNFIQSTFCDARNQAMSEYLWNTGGFNPQKLPLDANLMTTFTNNLTHILQSSGWSGVYTQPMAPTEVREIQLGFLLKGCKAGSPAMDFDNVFLFWGPVG